MQVAQLTFWVVVALVLVALAFDFMNGFHDAANSIGTVVSTGVLKPGQAILFAAFFNLAAILVFHLSVATTISQGIVESGAADSRVVAAALAGALVWCYVTWHFGIPSSSSHAMVASLVGAMFAKAGAGALIGAGIAKTAAFILIAPLLAFLFGSLMMVGVAWAFRRATPSRIDRWFRRAQLVSAGAYSLGHGGNDAQKTIGIIWLLLIATGYSGTAAPPGWTIVSCYVAIALGTLLGGWRVVKTMSQKITKLRPVGAVCAESGGAITLFIATVLGIPVSTTHTTKAAIVGVGAPLRASPLRWGVAGTIVWAWVLTMPASAALAALTYWASQLVF